jgi:hypothetical protein
MNSPVFVGVSGTSAVCPGMIVALTLKSGS